MYELPMKLEDVGKQLTTLEMHVVLINDNMGFFVKPQFYDVLDKGMMQKSHKIPAKWSLNRSLFLRSVVPASLLKCIAYASSDICKRIGVINCIFGYVLAGLPWKQVLYRLLRYTVTRELPKEVFMFIGYLLRRQSDLFPT